MALAEIFLAGIPTESRGKRSDDPAVEQALRQQLDIARASWPGIDVATDDVLALAAEHVAGGDAQTALVDRIGNLQMADLYIACGCAAGDVAALRAFEVRYFASLPAVLARLGGDDAAAEVSQLLREKLFVALPDRRAKILDLAGHGDLAALVRIAAVRTALNLRRSTQRLELVDHPSILSGVVLGPDPESGIVKELQSDEVKRAFEDAMSALEPRERNVLRLHVLHGLGIDEIGRLHNVHRSTAARWLDRIRDRLREETARLLRERLSLRRDEIDSLIEFVHSRLEISFDRLLARP